jgi:hypothetical protein
MHIACLERTLSPAQVGLLEAHVAHYCGAVWRLPLLRRLLELTPNERTLPRPATATAARNAISSAEEEGNIPDAHEAALRALLSPHAWQAAEEATLASIPALAAVMAAEPCVAAHLRHHQPCSECGGVLPASQLLACGACAWEEALLAELPVSCTDARAGWRCCVECLCEVLLKQAANEWIIASGPLPAGGCGQAGYPDLCITASAGCLRCPADGCGALLDLCQPACSRAPLSKPGGTLMVDRHEIAQARNQQVQRSAAAVLHTLQGVSPPGARASGAQLLRLCHDVRQLRTVATRACAVLGFQEMRDQEP